MKALATYLIAIPGLFVAPILLSFLFFAPGLVGLLEAMGLSYLASFAYVALGALALVFLALAFVNARGTFYVRKHAADMLPWMVAVIAIAAVAGAVR